MLYKLLITFALILILSTGSQPVFAQQSKPGAPTESVPALLVKANAAYAAKDYLNFRRTLETLNKKRPNNSDYMYQLVIAHALLDEKSQAYNLMLSMQQQGLAYDFTQTTDTMSLRGTEVFDYVNDLMKMAGDPIGESEKVFVLPDDVLLPEAIAWDESRQKFLIGTVAEGQIVAVGMDGQHEELLRANKENGLWAIIDILVDQSRNRLWVTSAAVKGYSGFNPVDKGRSGLFEFNLETLELVRRYPVPVDGQPHKLGSMVLNPNGDIYIADRILPLIYLKLADDEKLKPVMALREMISQRGLAMQPDGRVMYVADREMGIMVVDVKAGKAGLLQGPETLNLGGIDGLYLKDNRLFVIQNGISPQRVMRLELNTNGTKVENVRPLAVAQPDFDLPSFGTIEGDSLYYFANSQHLGKKGSQKPVTVLRTDLDSSADLVQPEMKKFLEDQAEKNNQDKNDDS